MRGLIDLVFGREPETVMASVDATPPAKSPREKRAEELRQIAACYRAIGAHDMAAEYEAQADQLPDRLEAALFIHHIVEGLPLPQGAWR